MNIKNFFISRGVLFWQCAAFCLFSLNLAQRIILSLVGQENQTIIWQFVGYVLAVLFLQCALCLFLWRVGESKDEKIKKTKKRKKSEPQKPPLIARWQYGRLIFATFLTFNILGLFLSYTIFAGLIFGARFLILMTIFAILSAVFIYGKRAIFIGLTLLCLSANAEITFQLWQKTSIGAHAEVENWRDLFAKKYQQTSFVKKPNVYIFSWDGLTPEAIAEEYLQLPKGSLPYLNYLKESGFRVFRNVFTDSYTTPSPGRKLTPILSEGSRVFHNGLLFLDPQLWETQPGNMDYFHKNYNYPGQFHYFAGRRPSPLYEIFKENDYKILVSYQSNYFGKGGPYVDTYLIPSGSSGQCNFGLPWFHFQSMGFCQIRRHILGVWQPTFRPHSHAAHVRQALPVLRQNALTEQPWLNFVYFNSPGHTPLDYLGLPQQKEQFRRRLEFTTKETVNHMKQLMNMIRRDDPEAIVFFVGDHGFGLRRAIINKQRPGNEEEKRFHMLDGHGVVGAIYPADACEAHMNFSTKYTTPSMVVRAIVKCLAGGKDPIDWEVDYGAVYSDAHLNDYLYE